MSARKIASLYWTMLRHRVAIILWLLLLLGAASADGLTRFHIGYLWAALVLTATHVSATTINDISTSTWIGSTIPIARGDRS
jgi:hypothetical protein